MISTSSSTSLRLLCALASLLLTALFVGIFANIAPAATLNVLIDQATLVNLDKHGSEVIIGNPAIADVAVQSGDRLVVTGKSSGLTNLMVLDGAGKLIYNNKVFVSADSKALVTVSRGSSRETYSCAPKCDPSLTPGDAEEYFEPLAKGIRNKLGLAQSAVDGSTPQQ